MLTFYRFKDKQMACRNNFQNHRKFSEKNVPLKPQRSWVFPCVCHDICCHKEAFQKPIVPCHDYLFFSFQSDSSSMPESTFSLPYTSWLPTCLPFWVAHIFLIFSLSFFFWIKPFSFLSMTTLFFYPFHKNCLYLISFIYSPTTHYVQLVLPDVGFLEAHISTSISPSTSAPYLG